MFGWATSDWTTVTNPNDWRTSDETIRSGWNEKLGKDLGERSESHVGGARDVDGKYFSEVEGKFGKWDMFSKDKGLTEGLSGVFGAEFWGRDVGFVDVNSCENPWEPRTPVTPKSYSPSTPASPISPKDSPLSSSLSPSQQKRNIDIEAELNKQNLYKTEMCRSWVENGLCRYGPKCQFAHGQHELRPVMRHPKYKTEICKTFHTTGTCPYGKRCRFIHRPSEGGIMVKDMEEISEIEGSMDQIDSIIGYEEELSKQVEEIKLNLSPDPVFPIAETQERKQKKGSRLPFFRKLRKQKH